MQGYEAGLFGLPVFNDNISIEKCENGFIVKVYKSNNNPMPPPEMYGMKAMAKIMPEMAKSQAQAVDEGMESWKPKKKGKDLEKIIDDAYAPLLIPRPPSGPKIYVFIDKQKLMLFLSAELEEN